MGKNCLLNFIEKHIFGNSSCFLLPKESSQACRSSFGDGSWVKGPRATAAKQAEASMILDDFGSVWRTKDSLNTILTYHIIWCKNIKVSIIFTMCYNIPWIFRFFSWLSYHFLSVLPNILTTDGVNLQAMIFGVATLDFSDIFHQRPTRLVIYTSDGVVCTGHPGPSWCSHSKVEGLNIHTPPQTQVDISQEETNWCFST